MKISVTFEKEEILKLVQQELARRGFRPRDPELVDYDGPFEVRMEIEMEPLPAEPPRPAPPVLPSAPIDLDGKNPPPGAPGSPENPLDISSTNQVDMGDVLSSSHQLRRERDTRAPFRSPVRDDD